MKCVLGDVEDGDDWEPVEIVGIGLVPVQNRTITRVVPTIGAIVGAFRFGNDEYYNNSLQFNWG